MFRSTLTLPAGALTLVVMLVACGGGGSPTNAPPAATTAATVAATSAATPAATVAATPTSAPTATVRATLQASENGRIAFAVRAGDSSNIFSMLPDGSDMQQLTTDAGNHLCASYSADATQIAYCGDGGGAFEIWTINADGTEPTQVTHLGRAGVLP